MAVQAANARFPSWLDWYQGWTPDWRVRAAAVGIGAVVAALWVVSVRTENKYEARMTEPDPQADNRWALTQGGFWMGRELVRRQRSLHAAGALAVTALVLSRPVHGIPTGRLVVAGMSVVVLVLVAVTLLLRLADRHHVSLAGVLPVATRSTLWCRLVFGAGAAKLVAALLPGGWAAAPKGRPAGVPGLTTICVGLLLAQVALLVVLGVLVAGMARGRTEEAGFQPFFRGQVATLVVLLAICLGGLLGALVNVGAARLFGVPVSSAVPAEPVPNALQIPWPIAAFAFAPVGLLVGVAAAAVHLWWHWRRATSNFTAERPPRTLSSPAARSATLRGIGRRSRTNTAPTTAIRTQRTIADPGGASRAPGRWRRCQTTRRGSPPRPPPG